VVDCHDTYCEKENEEIFKNTTSRWLGDDVVDRATRQRKKETYENEKTCIKRKREDGEGEALLSLLKMLSQYGGTPSPMRPRCLLKW
jgi:hypothetical protein